MRFLTLIIFQLGILLTSAASDQVGYYLKENGDTVKGMVDVELKKVSGKKEVNFGEMEMVIAFTEPGAKTKRIRAEDVAGYGFIYEDTWYHFEVLDMKKNFWKKNQGMGERKINNLRLFIHRAYEGAVVLYKDYFKRGMSKPGIGGVVIDRSDPYGVELFIKSAELGFVEVAPPTPGAYKKLKEFFMKYLSLDEEFLKTVDEKTKFTEAEEILIAYNLWKKKNG
ncbi:MAG: hypothetical protein WAT34_09335 [Chitinophagaceae bacterium]